jgi:hypothetical protein
VAVQEAVQLQTELLLLLLVMVVAQRAASMEARTQAGLQQQT